VSKTATYNAADQNSLLIILFALPVRYVYFFNKNTKSLVVQYL